MKNSRMSTVLANRYGVMGIPNRLMVLFHFSFSTEEIACPQALLAALSWSGIYSWGTISLSFFMKAFRVGFVVIFSWTSFSCKFMKLKLLFVPIPK